ncbi:hypothetical protein RHGRI_018001 [Rhododendron griersonianum]|uniref:Uncharacterized protein n=1 Tax=Rhododendron griersonianum TaxID=479676 RepID=A0AAV6JZV5_9ERIC|nr:hypothetical protein RHGRI_018001 [Rhododendron griersonianum]
MGSKTIAFLGLFLAVVLFITSEVTARDLAETTTSTASIYRPFVQLKLLNRPMGLMMPSIMVVAVDTEVVGMEVADAVDMEVAGMEVVAEEDMEAAGMEVADAVDMEAAEVDMVAADTEVAEVDMVAADTEAAEVDMEAAVTKKGINVIDVNI